MEATEATQKFLNATQNYPLLSGQKVNLYKCFLPTAWKVASQRGVVGLLHPEGPYDDPKAAILRAAMYPRLRGHFQFINERNLFPEVHHHTKFSINIYGPETLFRWRWLAAAANPWRLRTYRQPLCASHGGRLSRAQWARAGPRRQG